MNKGRKVINARGRDTIERFLIDKEREYRNANKREEALWVVTVRFAWADAFYTPTAMSRSSDKVKERTRREAINFLTGNSDTGAGREAYCDSAEISPEWIKEQAEKALKNGPPQPAPPRIYCELDEDNSMRATNTRWCRIREMEKSSEKKKTFHIQEGM